MRNLTRLAVVPAITLAAGFATFAGDEKKPALSENDKAYYADSNVVNFVRPGLVLKILSARITEDGTISARIRLTDPKSQPLDREGLATPGAVSVSFVAATIPKEGKQYQAYTARVVTSTITNVTATQPSTDQGGAFEKVAEGEYVYTFKTRAPSGYDRTATHTIGAYASRDLREDFDLGIQYSNDVFTFVPDGSGVLTVRDVVRTETCNKRCHDPLALHGGGRREVGLCILCHNPQNFDPDTGNTVDFPVLIHKIHMGADLPSVKAGQPYQIIGFGQRTIDFSEIAFPADVRNCQVCHDPDSGAAQADAWLNPNRTACGSCHDLVNFATGEGHRDMPEISDKMCPTCHIPEGELEYDASIRGGHLIDTFSRELPGTVFEILRVTDGLAGKRPTVEFTVKDKAGNTIPLSEMTSLGLVLAGPTSDYATAIREDARQARGSGPYSWTFQASIPAEARGSYSIGIEGYRNVKLQPSTRQERTVRDAGVNQVTYFSVDGSPVEPRRTVVATEKCNACHYNLSMHGSNRNRTEHCVQCHNPNATDAARRPASEMPAQTITFKTMIHRIHTGHDSEAEFVVYGYGNQANDFGEVHFPGDRRNCEKCHVNGSEQLPLKDNLLDVTNPRGLLNPMGPAAAACLGCHTSVAAASHALSMTTKIGEACAACHGSSAEFSVKRVHAR